MRVYGVHASSLSLRAQAAGGRQSNAAEFYHQCVRETAEQKHRDPASAWYVLTRQLVMRYLKRDWSRVRTARTRAVMEVWLGYLMAVVNLD